MASASTRTAELHVLTGGEGGAPSGPELLRLRPSPRLERFVTVAAEAGLDAEEAVRLGLEHALCLGDAARFAADAESGRQLLARAAARARPVRAMSPPQAAYVRRLTAGRPVAPADVRDGLAARVPDRILARVRASLPESSLHEEMVAEMVSWEVAATLCCRTMGEWALLRLLEEARVA
ncbi:MAG TPA: hypothetical protein VK889_04260 [Solirubrobacterales bacterium]|nr:hypothetical protein [Solirubrobacterales bacterium]